MYIRICSEMQLLSGFTQLLTVLSPFALLQRLVVVIYTVCQRSSLKSKAHHYVVIPNGAFSGMKYLIMIAI